MASEQVDEVELVEGETVTKLSGAVLIAALTGVLAQFSIPLPGGIPFSFQPFGVFFAGLLLGPLWGGFAMGLYVVVGVAGAPIFANLGAGLGVILGPTGGFLIAYPLSAFLIGYVAHRSLTTTSLSERSPVWLVVSLLAGLIVMYLIATPWWAEVQGLTIAEGVATVTPFFAGDLLKILVAVGMVVGGSELFDERI